MRHTLHLLCCALLLSWAGCGQSPETELDYSHAYMDSLRTMLGELRLMDHELRQILAEQSSSTVSAHVIVPVIRSKLRPTISSLHERADDLRVTAATDSAHQLFLLYLQKRLDAYNQALQAQAESRPELFEAFALTQIKAETIGRELEDTLHRLRSEIPGYH